MNRQSIERTSFPRVLTAGICGIALLLSAAWGYAMDWSIYLGRDRDNSYVRFGGQLSNGDYLIILHRGNDMSHGCVVSSQGKLVRDDISFPMIPDKSVMGDNSFLLAGTKKMGADFPTTPAVLYSQNFEERMVMSEPGYASPDYQKGWLAYTAASAFIRPGEGQKPFYVLVYNRFERALTGFSTHIIAFDEEGETLWRRPLSDVAEGRTIVRRLEQQGDGILAYADVNRVNREDRNGNSPKSPPRLIRFGLDGAILQQFEIPLPEGNSMGGYKFLVVDKQRVILPLTFQTEKVQRFYLVDITMGTVKLLNSLPFFPSNSYYTQLRKLKDGKFLLYSGLHPLVILDSNLTPIEYCFVENAISLLFVDRDGACIMNLFGFDAEGQQGCGVARITGGDFTGIEGGVLEQRPEWGNSTPAPPIGADSW